MHEHSLNPTRTYQAQHTKQNLSNPKYQIHYTWKTRKTPIKDPKPSEPNLAIVTDLFLEASTLFKEKILKIYQQKTQVYGKIPKYFYSLQIIIIYNLEVSCDKLIREVGR